VEYINTTVKVKIICKEHGAFLQLPGKHLMGHGCKKCIKYKLRLAFGSSKEEFIKKSKLQHGDRYDYSKVEYINAHKKVIIICPKHGYFLQEPNSHINGCGCPRCAYSNKSKIASKWLSKFSEIEKEYIIYIDDKKYIVDGFDKSLNIVYEYYCDFWNGNPLIDETNEINNRLKKHIGN